MTFTTTLMPKVNYINSESSSKNVSILKMEKQGDKYPFNALFI